MVGHNYTTQQIANRIDAGYTAVTYYAYATTQHERGEINTWHRRYETADRVAGRDATNHLGVAYLSDILASRN